jgi:hypothetical protein
MTKIIIILFKLFLKIIYSNIDLSLGISDLENGKKK